MNHLGLTLAWLAIQVAIVLVPALGLQALASRRGPASGAWVATLSLGLVVVLGLIGFAPRIGPEIEAIPAGLARSPEGPTPSVPGGSPLASASSIERLDPASPGTGPGLSFEALRKSWSRLGRRAAEPAERFRGRGNWLAIVFLVGMGVGSCRLLIGLWAVGICRRRGRLVDDPVLVSLLDELRDRMGCRPAVELREVPDLTTPATAGWRRPMLLLPGDWRSWDDSERRAVVAHELAHIIRGDYAAGLLARVAVVLNYHHPLVRWMAARLHLEQELAADSMGARFSGGRAAYLVALSSLALKQDGRSPSWPARAFLPARGTLIRRIKMLKNETETINVGPTRSKAWRLAMALGLISLTIGAATLKGPARAAEESPSPAPPADPKANASDAREVAIPFDVRYVPERMTGVVAIRPAAMARRPGMGRLMSSFQETILELDLATIAKELQVDITRPGFRKLGLEDIESFVCGFRLGQPTNKAKNADGEPLHSIEFGGVTVRAVAPFDWPAFLRQWRLQLEEVKIGREVCYKITGPMADEAGVPGFLYLPDDRTMVCDEEKSIRALMARGTSSPPAYLRGADWDRASRGLLAVAVNNRDDDFVKQFDLGRPDDAAALPLFRGVDRWTLGLADSDAPSPHAEVTARDPQSAELVARSIVMLVKMGRAALDSEPPATGEHDHFIRLYKAFLANLRVEQAGPALSIRSEGFGTFGEWASILKASIEEEAKAAAANPKAEKR